MRAIFKLILFAGLVYGGWWLWQNYNLTDWYNHCVSQPKSLWLYECTKLPAKKGGQIQSEMTIQIKECGFFPSQISVDKLQRVIWYNNDSQDRQVSSDYFDSGIINPQKIYTRKFNQTGTFNYFCADKPENKGQIIVK